MTTDVPLVRSSSTEAYWLIMSGELCEETHKGANGRIAAMVGFVRNESPSSIFRWGARRETRAAARMRAMRAFRVGSSEL